MTHSPVVAKAAELAPEVPTKTADILSLDDFKGEWTFMPHMQRLSTEAASDMLEGMEVTQTLDMGAYIMHCGRHWKLGRTVIVVGANEDCAVISRAAETIKPKRVESITSRLF